MKIKKGIIIFAVIVLILYIAAKSFCFYAYSKRIIQNEDQILELQKNIEEKRSVDIYSKNQPEDTFSYEGLKIKNEFEKLGDNLEAYDIKDTDFKVLFSKKDKKDQIQRVIEESKQDGLYYDLTKDLEKNKVTNDYELYKYLLENINSQPNIFSSINKIRKSIAINVTTSNILSNTNQITLIKGDYDGYIVENDFSKGVFLNHEDAVYGIGIYGQDFKEEDLYELISTISFE